MANLKYTDEEIANMTEEELVEHIKELNKEMDNFIAELEESIRLWQQI